MTKALVTGGAGFIGSHIADALLRAGYNVVVLDNESTGYRENVPKRAEYIQGDITIKSDVLKAFENKIDLVLHIAGKASTIKSFHDPLMDLKTNIIGTTNILETCLFKKVQRLLYASSMTCYGYPEKVPISLENPCSPVSYYGVTKYAAERYVHATGLRNDLDFDFNVTSFRMFNVYGERQSLENPYQGVMAIFISNALLNNPITIYGDGMQSRDFIYINDVVKAWVASIENKRTYGEVFNLGTGHAVSINKLVDRILRSTGDDLKKTSVIYEKERPGDQRHMIADISKTREILNWEPTTNIDEGIDRTLCWARKIIN